MANTTNSPEFEDFSHKLDLDRWLVLNGLVSETVRENLLAYGWLCHWKVKDVDITMDVENKKVSYGISLSSFDHWLYNFRLKVLKRVVLTDSLWKKYLKVQVLKGGIYWNAEENLRKYINDYLPGYQIIVKVEKWQKKI